MDRYEEVVEAYESERRLFEVLVKVIVKALEPELRARKIYFELGGRAKEVMSFAKKALREGYANPLREIGDKAGVRVIVPYLRDVPAVEEAVKEICHVERREQKLDALDYSELGYLGVHLDVRLRAEIVAAKPELANLRAELQIHSKAQSAWAVVSHDLLYKPPVESPQEAKRAITRLVALVELFDGEVYRLRESMESDPDYAEMSVMSQLDDLLIRFTVKKPDRKLSALSIPALVRLYKAPPSDVTLCCIAPFVDNNAAKLRGIYASYEDDDRANPLLSQPESLLIFERLENDRDRLREAWPVDRLSFDLLEGMAVVAGVDL